VSGRRVAVNLLWLAPGRVGGSEQYLTRQLAGLPLDAGLSLELMVQREFRQAYPGLCERFELAPMPFPCDWRGARLLAEHTWLVGRTRSADLVHHGGGTVPFVGRRPIVLTIHDLQYLQFPQYFSHGRRSYLRLMMSRSASRATVIATPTEFVRATVVEAFGVDAGRVVVVPHGVPATTVPSADAIAATRHRFGIGRRPFVIYPAITHPHKGHRLLIEMLRHLTAAEADLALVLVGGEGRSEADVRAAIAAAGMNDRVIRPGRVAEHDLDALMTAAEALVFPSEYEGFGAPLVEAMLAGTPIVCSAHPAVREVVGDAGLVVADADPQAWAEQVRSAIADRERLIEAGFRRARAFTLDISGRALLDTYLLALDAG
jgi:alpha-1,3-rhamnosyl/mannosyltransferase